MSIDDPDAALQIVEAGRRRVVERLRDAFAHQVGATADLGEIDPAALDDLISQATDRAGASLWRISLAEGAAAEFGITVPEALTHPAVSSAELLVGPPEQPEPVPGWSVLPAQQQEEPELPSPAAVDLPPFDPEEDPDDAHSESSARERLARWNEVVGQDDDGADDDDEGAADPDEGAADLDEGAADLDGGTADAGLTEVPSYPELEAVPELASEPAPATLSGATSTAPSTPQALRVAAVHTGGIETLKAGDKDLELRLSPAGLDVIRRSSGAAIGRLDWSEVTAIAIDEPKKRLRGRKARVLSVRTARGQAGFELPGLTDEEAAEHLEPMLERLRESGQLGTAAD